MPLLDPTSNELKKDKLFSAAIIGATTSGSSRIWVRTYAEGHWTLVIAKTPLQGDLVRLQEKPIAQFMADMGIEIANSQSYDFTQQTNLTHTFDITGLDADTIYYYAVISGELDAAKVPRRTELGGDKPLWFRTMSESPAELTFGFYSCHDHISANGDVGAWPHFLEKLTDTGAHFVIGGGDQIYVDTNAKKSFPDIWQWLKDNREDLLKTFAKGDDYDREGIQLYLLNIYRWYYRVYWNVSSLREVYERFPQYMVWDDHEIMDGWGSYTHEDRLDRIFRMFEHEDEKVGNMLIDLMWKAACQAYYEYEHSHNPVTAVDLRNPDACQWDYDFKHGSSAFYMLEMRGHHDLEKDKKIDPYIILGRDQFNRFKNWLVAQAAGDSKFLFVVSPVPVLHWIDNIVNYADLGGAKDDFMDEWGHETNWNERNQILEQVFSQLKNGNKTLIFLSGDVHCASIFRMHHKSYRGAKVYQLTSSAISRKPAPAISYLGITNGGTMAGNDKIYSERLFALAGNKNFSILRVRQNESGVQTVTADLYWPSGDSGEITKKQIVFD